MDLPDLSEIPHVGLGTAALVVLAVVAGFILFRGAVRVLWATLVLCASAYLGFLVWQRAPQHLRDTPDWMPAVLAVGAFLVAFGLLRFLGRFLIDPFGRKDGERGRGPGAWLGSLALGLVPAALLIFGGGLLLHHFGTLAELDAFGRKLRNEDVPAPVAWLDDRRADLEKLLPGEWFSVLDPATEKARVALAKVITTAEEAPPRAVPVLEEFQIRELVRDDPTLRELAAEGRYAEILRDPRLDRLLENDRLREVLAGLDL